MCPKKLQTNIKMWPTSLKVKLMLTASMRLCARQSLSIRWFQHLACARIWIYIFYQIHARHTDLYKNQFKFERLFGQVLLSDIRKEKNRVGSGCLSRGSDQDPVNTDLYPNYTIQKFTKKDGKGSCNKKYIFFSGPDTKRRGG